MTFMLLSFVLAMFIDSITVILFLAAVTVELAQLLKFNPVPVILSEIFCANLGGSATMCGDPPNIIIGTSLGFSFCRLFDKHRSYRGDRTGAGCNLFLLYFPQRAYKECRAKSIRLLLSGSFRRKQLQTKRIYHQLDHFPLCSCSSGNMPF